MREKNIKTKVKWKVLAKIDKILFLYYKSFLLLIAGKKRQIRSYTFLYKSIFYLA